MQGSRGWKFGISERSGFSVKSEFSHRSMRGALISSIGHKGLDISRHDQW